MGIGVNMNLSVKKVIPLDDFKLQLLFENNEQRVFNMKPINKVLPNLLASKSCPLILFKAYIEPP